MKNQQQSEHPEIRLSTKNHDFSSWFSEKTTNILRDLSHVIDCIAKVKDGTTRDNYSYEEELHDHLASVLVDAVKLVSIVEGKENVYDHSDYSMILHRGYGGYRELMKRYGMPVYEDRLLEQMEKNDIENRAKLTDYISGGRENRTIIHTILSQIQNKTAIEKQMEEDIEKVTMGIEPWDWFAKKYSPGGERQ